MNGMGTPRNNSKIDRIASLLYLESQEGKARPLNKCGLISFAFPRWSRQNSRKTRPSWCRVGHPTPRRRTARSCANYFVDPLAHWQHGRWPDDALNVRPRPISNWRHHAPSSSAPRPRPSGSARVVLQILLIIVGVAFGLWALHTVSCATAGLLVQSAEVEHDRRWVDPVLKSETARPSAFPAPRRLHGPRSAPASVPNARQPFRQGSLGRARSEVRRARRTVDADRRANHRPPPAHRDAWAPRNHRWALPDSSVGRLKHSSVA